MTEQQEKCEGTPVMIHDNVWICPKCGLELDYRWVFQKEGDIWTDGTWLP